MLLNIIKSKKKKIGFLGNRKNWGASQKRTWCHTVATNVQVLSCTRLCLLYLLELSLQAHDLCCRMVSCENKCICARSTGVQLPSILDVHTLHAPCTHKSRTCAKICAKDHPPKPTSASFFPRLSLVLARLASTLDNSPAIKSSRFCMLACASSRSCLTSTGPTSLNTLLPSSTRSSSWVDGGRWGSMGDGHGWMESTISLHYTPFSPFHILAAAVQTA